MALLETNAAAPVFSTDSCTFSLSLAEKTIQPSPCANVLLVDDNPANLLALEAMLGDLGHNLVRACSGEEALPTEGELAAITEMPQDPAGQASSKRVLVIEDNRAAAETLRILLELLGHVVRVAYDGVQGVKAAGEWCPDIILSDIGLPGLDGYAVARALRGNPHTAETKLIAVTGYDDPKDRQCALESGFDYVITKPAQPTVLIELLANGA